MKVGRNDPCPCGSGKKSKKCCGNKPKPLKVSARGSAPTPDECNQLVDLFNARRYAELENRTKMVIELYPNSGFAWKMLGTVLQIEGKESLPAMEKAAELMPDDADLHNSLGNVFKKRGQLADAEASYHRAIEINPDYAIAHYNLGNVLQIQKRLSAAEACYRRALELKSDLAEAHNNLGAVLKDLGRLSAAETSYRKVLKLRPDSAAAHNNLGNTLRDLRQFDAAVESFRRALEIQPDYAEAHNNLGNALTDLGQSSAAETSYRRALELKPDYAEAHNNLGNALKDNGQFDAAVESYRRALNLKPDYAEAHNNLGNILKDYGQFDAAAKSYGQALKVRPDYAEAHNNLGTLLKTLSLPDAAEASYRRALEIKPYYAEAHLNLANVLKYQSRIAEAEASCRRSLEINPNSAVASLAMVFMAGMATDKGQFKEAESLFRQAISMEPDLPEAWAGIAHTRKMTTSDSDKVWLTEAQRIAENNLLPRSEAHLRYSIGKYFDDVKNYEPAFVNFRRANDLSKVYCKKYVKRLQEMTVDRMINFYDRGWIKNQVSAGTNLSYRPVFIVGMPRSGTSLVEQILASHPEVFGAGELTFWGTTMQDMYVLEGKMSTIALRKLADGYLRLLEGFSLDTHRVVDKMPGNFQVLGFIHAALPNSRIIHLQRNPLDTCLSIFFKNFESHSYANDLENIAHYYTQYLRIMKHWHESLPQDAILNVSYEDLVNDQEGWTRILLDFIGVSWDERCLDFQKTARRVSTASNWQVRQKISTSSVKRWCNYMKFIEPLRVYFPETWQNTV